jgi:hypothetical protein
MSVIAVGFQHGHGFAARVIRGVCNGPFVHCEIVIDNRCFTTFMNEPWNRVGEYTHRPSDEAREGWKYLYFVVTGNQAARALRCCVEAKNTSYDYSGAICSPFPLFRTILAAFVTHDAAIFCSELAAMALKAAGVGLRLTPQTTDPCALYAACSALPNCSTTNPINASAILLL